MLQGNIVHGDGIGKDYGFPTANIDVKKPIGLDIHAGVYAGYAIMDKKKHEAAIAIQDEPWKVEVHLLDFPNIDLYGKHMEINLIQRVSEFEDYDTDEELIQKITNDVKLVRNVFQDIIST